MEIWSHRGRVYPSFPGNRLIDFWNAAKEGATGIEADVIFERVGHKQEILIHHPGTNCSLLRLSELIIFLRENPSLQCFLDIKQQDFRLVEAVVKIITENNILNRTYLTAFQTKINCLGLETSGELLLWAKIINPSVKTHLIATFPFNLPLLANKYCPDIISIGWLDDNPLSKLLFKGIIRPFFDPPGQIEEAKKYGAKVLAGIFDDKRDMRKFIDMGVDGIMTNNLYAARELKRKL